MVRGADVQHFPAGRPETLAYLATQDLTGVLPQIQTPTLIMVAEDSVANNPDRTTGMANLLPHARLLEIPGTSGYVQHSAPEKCVAAWRSSSAASRSPRLEQ